MTAALRHLGFEVIAIEEANHHKMQEAVMQFAEQLGAGDTGLFYYAGHGIQVNGSNYLIPLGAKIKSELSTRFEAIEVGDVLDAMENAGNKLNFVILDACRNNPFERRLRGQSRGLAAIDAAAGTLIAYATAPGSVAADGDGANGLYTESLLSALATPGLTAEQVFKRVRIEVLDGSHGQQVPWESSSLTGEFIFNVEVNATVNVTPSINTEALFWESIRDSNNLDDFRAYLARYPEGIFSGLAANRLGQPTVASVQPDGVSWTGRWKGEASLYGDNRCNRLPLYARIERNTVHFEIHQTAYEGHGRGMGTIDSEGNVQGTLTGSRIGGNYSFEGIYESPILQGTMKSRQCKGEWWLSRVVE